jgi:hypothetical protein
MTPVYQIKPGVEMGGIDGCMAPVLDIVPVVFARRGYDCWVTSAFRQGDPGKHGFGRGLDFDSSTHIPEETGHEIARSVNAYLGSGYVCIWHGPRWHLHVQKGHKDA